MGPTRSGLSLIRATGTPTTILAALGLTAAGAVVLRLLGRRLWCACASAIPWSGEQPLVDPYTLTHVLHGMLSYALLRCSSVPAGSSPGADRPHGRGGLGNRREHEPRHRGVP